MAGELEYVSIGSDSGDKLAELRSDPQVRVIGGETNDTRIVTLLAYVPSGLSTALRGRGFDVTVLRDADTVDAQWTNAQAQAGPTPAASLPAARGEFAVELLKAGLLYARARLNTLATEALVSADALAARLGGQLPAPIGDVVDDITAAVLGIDKVIGSVEIGLHTPSMDVVKAVLTPLSDTIDALAAAALKMGGDVGALLTSAVAAATPATGILDQLGLATGDGTISVQNGTVVYPVATASNPGIAGISAQRVELTARLTGAAATLPPPKPVLALTLAITGAKVAIPGADALLSALGLADGAIAADLTVAVDTDTGVTIGGATSGRIALPARKQAGPIDVKGLTLEFARDGKKLVLDLAALATGTLGPLSLTVDGAGIRLVVDPDDPNPLQHFTVNTPTGFGLALDAGPVSGGGFLAKRSTAAGITSYGGALTLRFGPVEVDAFGLITDGPQGFSFVAVMSVEIYPPIELGLLFTLNGVGGIVGIEVAADTEAMRARVRTGTLSQLMFPADPAGAAPSILDTLASVFPPADGGLVVGPMVKLGWGRPVSFVTAELALVISTADPKVVLIGRLRVAIPDPRLPLIDLRAEIFGEFSDDRVLILASLVDSRVGFFSVTGDFGLLVRTAGDPTFALSAGGFHPRYTAPAELAALRRVGAELSPPLFHLRVEAYVAITTNSLQFGGLLEIGYGVAGTGVFGHVGLDALLLWTSQGLRFEVDLSAGVSVRAFDITVASVDLRLHLSGPAPWLARGTGRVNLPWPLPDVSIDVGPVSWGQSSQPPPLQVSPRQLVREALSNPAAWQSRTGGGGNGVRVRSDPSTTPGEILVEPSSLLQVTQSAVPLATQITRVGASPVRPDEAMIVLGEPEVGAATAGSAKPVRSPVFARFAPGQYLDLTDDQQLGRPSFESFEAGMRIDAQGLTDIDESHASDTVLKYDTSFPRARVKITPELILAGPATALRLDATAAGGSVLRATDRYAEPGPGLPIAPPEQVLVRSATTLQPVAGITDSAITVTHAQQEIDNHGTAGLQLVALGAQ